MSARIHAARFDDALNALQFFTAWWGGWLPVKLGSWSPQPDRDVIWRQGPHSDLAELVRRLDLEYSDEITIGLPEAKPWTGGVGKVSVLWCRVEGQAQLDRARRFRPLPSLVIAEGPSTRRLLFWPLEHTVNWAQAVEMNRRIAYALHAVQKHGEPDTLRVPAPGTCLRAGRSRPVPVVCARLTTHTFTAASVCGRLKDPPPRDAWLAGRAAR